MPDHAPRAIRVFFSSTFRDFTAERDCLAKLALPALRRRCEDRGVVFTDVDLRWGITDEQAAEGQVLPICLEEIERSRPFFIGMLGERYGWIPDGISDSLIELEPWLAEHRDKSVTELEIVHGVLNDPEMAGRAFFYFRAPEYADMVAAERRNDFVSESPEATAKLAELKQHIRASGLPLREGFRSPEELVAQIEVDLGAAIDSQYPADATPEPLARERLLQEAFAAELSDGFVERPSLSAALDAHVAGEGPALLVTGPSGSGKSALLAHWTSHARRARPDVSVLAHLCGASSAAADWESACRSIVAELSGITGIQLDLPAESALLRAAFREALAVFGAAKRFVLVIDGVDQLEDRDAALDLAFLPSEAVPGCRLIVSAADGTQPAAEAVRRGWAVLRVGDLDVSDRQQVLFSLLARRRKTLAPALVDRICNTGVAASPLFISVLVDELSVAASHETLSETIDYYLAVSEPDDLYELVLARWERDYDARPGLTAAAMRMIWAARRGLTERELLDVLGGGPGTPMPQAEVAPLLLAAGRQLSSRSGLITFSHAMLRRAVEDRYLPTGSERTWAHGVLADYFDVLRRSTSPSGTSFLPPRVLEELPLQQLLAGRPDASYALLTDDEFLGAAWVHDPEDVRRIWVLLEENSTHRVLDAYPALRVEYLRTKASDFTPAFEAKGVLLGQRGSRTDIKVSRWARGLNKLLMVFGDSAAPYHLEAVKLFKESQSACAEGRFKEAVSSTQKARDLIAAGRTKTDAGSMAEELDRADGLVSHQLVNCLLGLDRTDEASAEAEARLARTAGESDPSVRGWALFDATRTRGKLDDAEGASSAAREAVAIFEPHGRDDALAMALQLLAEVQSKSGDTDAALASADRMIELLRRSGSTNELALGLQSLGGLLLDADRYAEARDAYHEAQVVSEELRKPFLIAQSLMLQGLVSRILEEYDRAETEILACLERFDSIQSTGPDILRMRGLAADELPKILDARYDAWQSTALASAGDLLDEDHYAESCAEYEAIERWAAEVGRDSIAGVAAYFEAVTHAYREDRDAAIAGLKRSLTWFERAKPLNTYCSERDTDAEELLEAIWLEPSEAMSAAGDWLGALSVYEETERQAAQANMDGIAGTAAFFGATALRGLEREQGALAAFERCLVWFARADSLGEKREAHAKEAREEVERMQTGPS